MLERCPALLIALAAVLAALQLPVAAEDEPQLDEMSLEELSELEVTTVSRKPQSRWTAADAVFVLTGDDIRRSGAKSIPEALRLVPEMQVAQIDSNKWAIGIRGFGSRLARSVLVQIDGRSVYNPLFAGTYWEIQDLVLDDIDRIEVIRGPSGALWGANAFNGVINIITKDSAATQGGLITAGGGSEERGFGDFRYGGSLGDDLRYRVYAKYLERDDGAEPLGVPYQDDWQMLRGGFRVDWRPESVGWLTLQGDLYDAQLGDRVGITTFEPPYRETLVGNADASGGNLLGRWTRALSATSEMSLQAYYDHTFRRDLHFREERDTFDLDGQHRFALPWRQGIVWGLGYRVTSDDTAGVPGVEFVPAAATDHLASAFLQDEIDLIVDRLVLTMGVKLQHNDYSGFEWQPNARLLWTPVVGHAFWGSVARAVRAPSRTEADVRLTAPPELDTDDPSECAGTEGCVFPVITGDEGFDSEELIAYQLGWRTELRSSLFVDTVVFYHDYDDMLTLEPGEMSEVQTPPPPHTEIEYLIGNRGRGESYGVSVTADAFPTSWWHLRASYSYLQVHLSAPDGITDGTGADGSSPQNQAFVFSRMNLPWRFQFDSSLRYVDRLPAQGIRAYFTFDVRLAYQVTQQIELAAVGRNLWDSTHREFAGGTEVERGAYAQVRLQW